MGALGDVWRPLGDAVGGFGGVLRAILAVFGALGGVLGTSWRFWEASWGRLGGVLEVMLNQDEPRRIFVPKLCKNKCFFDFLIDGCAHSGGRRGRFLRRLEGDLGCLWRSWRRLGDVLEVL